MNYLLMTICLHLTPCEPDEVVAVFPNPLAGQELCERVRQDLETAFKLRAPEGATLTLHCEPEEQLP